MLAAILIVMFCFLLCGLKDVAAAMGIMPVKATNGGFPEDMKSFSSRNAIQNPFVQAENRTDTTIISSQTLCGRAAETALKLCRLPERMMRCEAKSTAKFPAYACVG
jgi:hypothetical protein